MSRKDWIDPKSKRILPGAFILRPAPKDDDGLSVDISSPQSCVSVLNKSYGVGSLHVGRIRSLGLDVIVDEDPHALIKGLPRDTEDRAKAEWLASQLAKQTRFIDPEKYSEYQTLKTDSGQAQGDTSNQVQE